MDAKVRDILLKVKASAIDAGRSAGKVAGDLVNQAKINFRIIELNTEIESAYKTLGKMLYAVHNGVEIPADAIDETLSEIDGKKAEVDLLRDELQKTKSDVICPTCGKHVGKKASFCSACGAKIERNSESEAEEDTYLIAPSADGCYDEESFGEAVTFTKEDTADCSCDAEAEACEETKTCDCCEEDNG